MKIIATALSAMLACSVAAFFTACGESEITDAEKNISPSRSVNFLSVGQGDCCFTVFPDGKTLLIDCGEKSDRNFELISAYIDAAGGNIDYLVLTHTDSDHTGNAAALIEKYSVGRAYLPKVYGEEYTAFKAAEQKLTDKSADVKYSAKGACVKGEGYFFCLLAPDNEFGYDDINYGDATAKQINAASAVVYVDYCGVRFIITGDATKDEEETIVEDARAGLFSLYGSPEYSVNLMDVDFLKVSHHGAKEEISDDFYTYLNPLNAVISVGALNNYNHPSVYTLIALETDCPDINVLRTDVLGTIRVKIGGDGYSVITDADN